MLEYLLKRLPLYIFILEVVLLAAGEKKRWKTMMTPFNCLAIPYAVVVLVCVSVSGTNGYQYFGFSSLWVYVVGLLLFYIPSLFLGGIYKSLRLPEKPSVWEVPHPRTFLVLEWLTALILVLFVLHFFFLYFYRGLSLSSEEFLVRFAGSGLFGHLFTLLMVLGIIWISLADFKKNKRYIVYALGFVGIALLYQIKGWLLIPVIAAFILRIISHKARLNFKTLLGVIVLGFVFFFSVYWTNLYILGAKDGMNQYSMTRKEYAKSTMEYIPKHFLTYLTSGVYGFGEDVRNGILEKRDPAMIYAPYYNIFYLFTGHEFVDPVNPIDVRITFLDERVNVRSLMGTLYVFLGGWAAAAFMFISSCLAHILFFIARQRRFFFLWIFMGWLMGCLFMGWFDPYVQTLNFITVPVFIAGLWMISIYNPRSQNGLLAVNP